MPLALRQRLVSVKNTLQRRLQLLRYAGTKYHCPLCNRRFGRLKPSTGAYSIRGTTLDHYTANSVCPRCGSGIRHRFLFAFLQQEFPAWPAGLRILHFAPEPALARFFRSLPQVDYVAGDLQPCPEQNIQAIDIGAIPFAAGQLDLIVCSHVLEHIADDRRAIGELHCCLKPGGRALIAVPIYGTTTFEEEGLDCEGRQRMYGIGDHMRLNGLDFQEKLAQAGFQVRVVTTDDVPGDYLDRTASSPHIESDRYLFWCRK